MINFVDSTALGARQVTPEDLNAAFASTLADAEAAAASVLQQAEAAAAAAIAQALASRPKDRVSVIDYGAKGDGVTDDTAAFVAAAAASQSVYVPPGKFLIHGSVPLSNCALYGCGITPGGLPYDGAGSVILLIGTSFSPFIIGKAASITGLVFYYPNQTEAQITSAGVPIGYPATIAGDTATRVLIENCTFVNAYQCFRFGGTVGACGAISIRNCRGYAVRLVMHVQAMADVLLMEGCHWSWGFYQDAVNVGPTYNLKNWTCNNGEGIQITTGAPGYASVDGLTLRGNYWFGMLVAIHHLSGATFDLTANGDGFDGVATAYQIDDGASGANTGFSNCLMYTYNAANTTQAYPTMSVACSSGPGTDLSVTGCRLAEAKGNHIVFTGSASTELTVSGNQIRYYGGNITTGDYYGISVTAPNAMVTVTGNSFQGVNPSAIHVSIALAASANVSSNSFRQHLAAVQVVSVNRCSITGNTSLSTTGVHATSIASAAAQAVTLAGNAWDVA